MEYLKQLFSTPHNLWTIGQVCVFSLLILAGLAILTVIGYTIVYIVVLIKDKKKNKKEQKEKNNGNLD